VANAPGRWAGAAGLHGLKNQGCKKPLQPRPAGCPVAAARCRFRLNPQVLAMCTLDGCLVMDASHATETAPRPLAFQYVLHVRCASIGTNSIVMGYTRVATLKSATNDSAIRA
jgi:hypothetical protein